jgi:hypothetical protein
MQKYLIELGDAVIAAKDAQGRIKNQLINTTAAGAVAGTSPGSEPFVPNGRVFDLQELTLSDHSAWRRSRRVCTLDGIFPRDG